AAESGPTRPLPLQVPLSRPAPAFNPNPAPGRCRGDAPRPERFAIQDPRAELCRLHELLRGGACRIEGGSVVLSEERAGPSLFGFFPSLNEGSDFGAAARDPVLRERFAALEGLQTYLYSGRPCEFDQLGDLMDLMEAYTLYRSALNSPQAPLRQGFAEGRAGCILRRGAFREAAGHDHEVDGVVLHHHQAHDAIVTPATVALEGLPADTPVSDCLVLR
ncbi:MAG TPA: hypothetical protein VJR29_06935, partial [bacterium]|nr:hypothetical protein [bacterium]